MCYLFTLTMIGVTAHTANASRRHLPSHDWHHSQHILAPPSQLVTPGIRPLCPVSPLRTTSSESTGPRGSDVRKSCILSKFFRECVALAYDDRDVDLYHWSSTRFSRAWFDSPSVLVARGRAKVSVDAAASDWPKRIRDMQHIDHEDYAADYE